MPYNPAVRRDEILSESVRDELVVYDGRSNLAHALDPIAAAIWNLCDGNHGIEEIAAELGISTAAVECVIAGLHMADLLEPESTAGVNRREAVVRIAAYGATATVGASIFSISIGAASAAASTVGSLSTQTPGTYCVTVPRGQTTAHFTITGAGGGQGGITSILGGAGGGGAQVTGTLTGLVAGDIIIVQVSTGGGGAGVVAIGGPGGSGDATGGSGSLAAGSGGGGGGGATSISVLHGQPAGTCPANANQATTLTGTVLGVAGGGGGGDGSAALPSPSGGSASTSNSGTVAGAAGGNGSGILNGGGGAGGGVTPAAAGGNGGAILVGATSAGGGRSGWVSSNGVTITATATVASNGGGNALNLLGSTGGPGTALVTFP